MLPWDLEDWLTETGDRIVTKEAESGFESLSEIERGIYEVWLLDTETRNGGVSQYFANQDRQRWDAIVQLSSSNLPALRPFVAAVNGVTTGADDPYEAIIESSVDLDDLYVQHQIAIVSELRNLGAGAA